MSWIVLLLGLALWWAAHLFKRILPERRAALGKKGKGLVAGALAVAILLMVLGYRGTPSVTLWTPPTFLTHVNNLLVLLAFYLMSPAPAKGALLTHMRHPMLTGFGLWAIAHLLVNGDLASILLFGGLWAWSIVTKIVINKADPTWSAPEKGTLAWDAKGAAGAVLLVVVIGLLHGWLGPWPFGG